MCQNNPCSEPQVGDAALEAPHTLNTAELSAVFSKKFQN